MDNPRDAVNFYWLMETEMVAPSLDVIESGEFDGSMVRFYVFDGTVETKTTFERKKRINSAIAALDKMSQIKRKKVQKLIGLGLSNTASEEEVYNAIDEYLRTSSTALGLDPIDNFMRIMNYSDDMLDAKAVIRDLIDTNIVRVKGSVVYEGEHVWAKSLEEFELFMVDPKNTVEYEAFKDKLKQKLKINTL